MCLFLAVWPLEQSYYQPLPGHDQHQRVSPSSRHSQGVLQRLPRHSQYPLFPPTIVQSRPILPFQFWDFRISLKTSDKYSIPLSCKRDRVLIIGSLGTNCLHLNCQHQSPPLSSFSWGATVHCDETGGPWLILKHQSSVLRLIRGSERFWVNILSTLCSLQGEKKILSLYCRV